MDEDYVNDRGRWVEEYLHPIVVSLAEDVQYAGLGAYRGVCAISDSNHHVMHGGSPV
jgi:hypothetical protein